MDSSDSKTEHYEAELSRKHCLACNENFESELENCPQCHGTQVVAFHGEDNKLGKIINNKYKIVELLGKGGMGAVYLAEVLDDSKTTVAIKLLHAELSEDELSVKRFRQEASACADLHHPNLIRQLDFGMIEGKQPFLVMELLRGTSLLSRIREKEQLSPDDCVRIFSQVMDALKYAHDKGVVHRDIKPSNILLIESDGRNDFVKVLDFGLAKLMPWSGKESQHLTKTGEVFGSPLYMSPEQCMGKKLEPSSDIYSLGITLFEALTGRPPFRGQNVVQTAAKHLSDNPPDFEGFCPELNLPLSIQNMVFKALEKEPARRYLNMNEFKDSLIYAVSEEGKANSQPPANSGSDAGSSPKKIDLDSLKSGSFKKVDVQKEAKRFSAGLVAGIAAAGITAAILAAATLLPHPAASLLNNAPQHTSGTVYYVEMKWSAGKRKAYISGVHLKTDKGLLRLKGHLLPSSHQLLSTGIGQNWQVEYRGDKSSGILEKFEPTGDESFVEESSATVLNFMQYLASGDYRSAYEIFSRVYTDKNFKGLSDDSACDKLAESFKKLAVIDYTKDQRAPQHGDYTSVFVQPTGGTTPPPQATKILSAEPCLVKILLDSSYFYYKPCGFQLIELRKEDGFWKITNIKSGISKSEWISH